MPLGSPGSSTALYGDLIPGFGSTSSNVFEEDCNNDFGFTPALNLLLTAAVENVFGWAQVSEHNYFYEDVSNTFNWDSGAGYDYEEDLIQYLGFTPRTILPAVNVFGFESAANDVYAFSVDNTFTLAQILQQVYEAVNVFGWSQTVIGLREEDCFNMFAWAESLDTGATEFGRTATHTLLKQHLSYTVTGARCADKEYAPLVGDSGDSSYGDMPVTPPTLGSGTLTLTYPRVAPTLTLTLKNPEFGNTDTLSFTLIDELTRGGDRILYGDTKWATSQVFELSIVNICDPDMDELVTFLNTSLGKEIGLADWEGRNWAGVIIAPNTQMVARSGGYAVTLQFQGELVE